MTLSGFFPSRTISLYMARMFVVRTLVILAALVLILQTLDLLSETGDILAYPGNGQAQVLYYVSLRSPQILAEFLPFSVLLGTILTLITMNQNSEIIAMKASGLSAHQVLAPLLIASLGVAVISFGFNDRVVSHATAALNQWKGVHYGPMPISHGTFSNVWVRDGDDLIEVQQVGGRGDAVKLGGITIYDRDKGALKSIVTAPRGERHGRAWLIGPQVTDFDMTTDQQTVTGPLVIGSGVRPDQLTLASVDADGMSFGALNAAIHELHAAGRPTTDLEGALWHKLSSPLSSVLMPLLGAVAAFGIARSGKLFIRAVIGMALGFAYFVADNFALAMGNLGAYPPVLAAWAPFVLFLLIGEAVLIRTEE
ncbi:MAG: LPS export ABC transporter permease LptG [Sphingomonas sp.]